MAQKNNIGIQKIRYGEVHSYYPIKFDTSMTFDKLCEAIQKSSIIFNEDYQKKIIDSLGYSTAQVVKELKSEFEQDGIMEIRMPDFNKYKTMTHVPLNLKGDDIKVAIETVENSFRTEFVSSELESLERRIARLCEEEDMSREVYGKEFVGSHQKFLLLPFKLKLCNGESVWLHAILYLFANNMGFLKLEFPLINTDIIMLKCSDPSLFISEVHNKWDNKHSVPDTSLRSIADIYLKSLVEDSHCNLVKYNHGLKCTTLIDFEGQPKQINSLPKDIQEDLFRIICAPVQERQNTSYIKEAQEYLTKNTWRAHNVNYIIKTTGGCLAFIDQALLDIAKEDYKKQANVECLDTDDYDYICDRLAKSIHMNAEFALLIIMLKKMNEYNTYNLKINNPRKLANIQKEYNRNTIFINELQESCYGSVSEQIEDFENMLCHYLKPEITKSKLAAIDDILQEDEKKRAKNFEKFLALGGFLLSLIFGLPAIYDTLKIIRNVCSFLPRNIPNITIENSSVLLWALLNLFILLKIILKITNKFKWTKKSNEV